MGHGRPARVGTELRFVGDYRLHQSTESDIQVFKTRTTNFPKEHE
jgi:hypothetical protein